MPKFRKKPVEIEAVQWLATKASWDAILAMGCPTMPGIMETGTFLIPTLEGDMTASKGDWIIKGVSSEFYPCKPDIFEKTYDLVEEKSMSETKEKDATFPTAAPPQTDLDRAGQEANDADEQAKKDVERVDDLGEKEETEK